MTIIIIPFIYNDDYNIIFPSCFSQEKVELKIIAICIGDSIIQKNRKPFKIYRIE